MLSRGRGRDAVAFEKKKLGVGGGLGIVLTALFCVLIFNYMSDGPLDERGQGECKALVCISGVFPPRLPCK